MSTLSQQPLLIHSPVKRHALTWKNNQHQQKRRWKLSHVACVGIASMCLLMHTFMLTLAVTSASTRSSTRSSTRASTRSSTRSSTSTNIPTNHDMKDDVILREDLSPVDEKRRMRGAMKSKSNNNDAKHSFPIQNFLNRWFVPTVLLSKNAEQQRIMNLKSNDNHKANNDIMPEVAWLMSFPNSGTSYTLRLVHTISNTSVATNYEQEIHKDVSKPVYPIQSPYGPFMLQSHLALPQSYILTKTHCAGYCNDCPIKNYVVDRYEFAQHCAMNILKPSSVDKLYHQDPNENSPPSHASTDAHEEQQNNEKEKKAPQLHNNILYNHQIEPHKTIRLVRDPFSNVVSNFHHWINRQEREKSGLEKVYTDDFKGFQHYCQFYNLSFDKQLSQLAKSGERKRKQKHGTNFWMAKNIFQQREIEQLLKIVPCHQHFFRYVSVSFYVVVCCLLFFKTKRRLY